MARQQQRYSMNHHHQHPRTPYHPPHNPFQGKGRNILPRYTPVTPREGVLSRVLKQACVVLTIGTILVSALSLAIPPSPTDVNSMAAPRPIGIRKGGGVRSQSRLRTANKKPDESRHSNTSHHWDADTLESENQALANDDGVSSDESPAAKASKEELAAKIESKTKEENTVADGAFGRKEDEQKVKSASGDGEDVDPDTDSTPKGSVKVDALDSQDKNSKDLEVKTNKHSEQKDSEIHQDSNYEKDTANSLDKVIDVTDDKEEMGSRNESWERTDALGDDEGSTDTVAADYRSLDKVTDEASDKKDMDSRVELRKNEEASGNEEVPKDENVKQDLIADFRFQVSSANNVSDDAAGDMKEMVSRDELQERKDSSNDVEGFKDGNVNQDSKADSRSIEVNEDGTAEKVSQKVDKKVAKYDDKQQDENLGSNENGTSAESISKEDDSGVESVKKAEKESVQGNPLDSVLERTPRVAQEVRDVSDDTPGDGHDQKASAR